MLAELLAGALAGLAVALPIGPIGTYLIGLSAREKLSTAAAAAPGVATVDDAYALLAAFGGAGLQPLLRGVSEPLTVLVAVVFVAVSIRTRQSAVRHLRRRDAGPCGGLAAARSRGLVRHTMKPPRGAARADRPGPGPLVHP